MGLWSVWGAIAKSLPFLLICGAGYLVESIDAAASPVETSRSRWFSPRNPRLLTAAIMSASIRSPTSISRANQCSKKVCCGGSAAVASNHSMAAAVGVLREEALTHAATHTLKRHMVVTHPSPVLLKEGPGFKFEFISQCDLPTDKGLFTLRAYRYTKDGKQVEPVALFQGDLRGKREVLLRVHDQCLTSEVLGSKRCDCKEQLDLAIDKVTAERGGGLILYLPQEGRGIGLANKVAAYSLQEQGLDTVDANLALGFGDDERTYDYVPYILEDFGMQSVRLCTNNPFKVRSLRDAGVEVSSVIPLQATPNPHNMGYLKTKFMKMEHVLDFEVTGTVAAPVLRSVGNDDDEDEDEAVTTCDSMTDSGDDRNSTTSSEHTKGDDVDDEADEVEARLSMVTTREASATIPGLEPEVTPSESRVDRYCFGKETVIQAIEAIREGEMVLVVDDEDRENEGDLIMAADAATTASLAFIVRYGSGVVCVAMEGSECDRLELPPMVPNNQDPKKTAFTVSVDSRVGTTTGISAHDRAVTLRMLASPSAIPSDFTRPGHIFPLRYAQGGVLNRRGHTEAAVDLSRLAGRRPAGVLCEVCNDDGSMARLPELREFAKKHNLVLTSIADLVAYRVELEGRSS